MKQAIINWQEPPAHLKLSFGKIHLWLVDLTKTHTSAKKITNLLSLEEKKIAKEKLSAQQHKQYTVSHGALRHILGKYTGIKPQQIIFQHDLHGKPHLTGIPKHKKISFNMSHSNKLTLIAVTRGRHIGVDLEHIRPLQFNKVFLNSFFTKQERKTIRSLPASQQTTEVLKIWTHKEACLKVQGKNITSLLNQKQHNLFMSAYKSSTRTFVPARGYVATLAQNRPIRNHSYWQWDV